MTITEAEAESYPRGRAERGLRLGVGTALAMYAAAFAVVFVSQNRVVGLYDEGIVLTGAARVAAGAVIHRDFYAGYGPAQFYAVAALFKAFGPSIFVERIWDAAIKAGTISCVYAIGSRLAGRAGALFATLWTTVWLAYVTTPGYPLWPALFTAMLGVLATFRAMDEWTTPRLLVAGMCVGLTVLFRYDVGFFFCAAETLVLFLYCRAPRPAPAHGVLRATQGLLTFWGGTACVCVPVALAYWTAGAIPDFWFDIVQYPGRYYARMRNLPFPSRIFTGLSHPTTEYIVYLPIAAALCGAVAFHYSRRRAVDPGAADDESQWRWRLALLATVTLAFFSKGYVRVSSVHMGIAVIPAIVVIATVAARYPKMRVGAVAAALGLAFIIGAVPTLRAAARDGQYAITNLRWLVAQERAGSLLPDLRGGHGWCGSRPGLFRAACFDLGAGEQAAALFLQSKLAPGAPLYVGLLHHDRTYANDVALYFAAGFVPITKWYHFDPGLQNSAATQTLMLADFERDAPQYIVLDSVYDGAEEPNASALSSGVALIDRYIRAHYHRVAAFGTCWVEERNTAP